MKNAKKIITMAMAMVMGAGATGYGSSVLANSIKADQPAAAAVSEGETVSKQNEASSAAESKIETMTETETAAVSETDTVSEIESVSEAASVAETFAESIAPFEIVPDTENDYPAFVDDQYVTDASYDNLRGPSYMGTFTAQRLFDMTLREAVEMGTDYWQIVPSGIQAIPAWGLMYECTALPGYAFASTNGYDGNIDCVNVLGGGYVSDNIFVGMTYNEICEKLGAEIGVSWTNDDLYYSSIVTIDGITWRIGFDLTEDQTREITNRFDEYGVDRWDGKVDISDIDPVSTVAVHYSGIDD